MNNGVKTPETALIAQFSPLNCPNKRFDPEIANPKIACNLN